MGTWIVGAVVLAVICAAGYYLCKDRKKGKSCCGGCGGCQGCTESERNITGCSKSNDGND